MTTLTQQKIYELQHIASNAGRLFAVYNPRGVEPAALPVIYGFNNGGDMQFLEAIAIAEDGTVLGQHLCSSEAYMPHDLGMLEGTRPDRHEQQYSKHYPDGYRMEFVWESGISSHAGLTAAIARAKARMEAEVKA